MKQVFKYDENGAYMEPVIIQDNDPIPDNCTDKELPQPNWKPVFNGTEWVETATEEEKNPPIQEPEPSPSEQRMDLMQKALDDLILGVM